MFAVQTEAISAFSRKDWVTLASLVRAFDEPQARFAAAWADLEGGRIDEGLTRIRQLFASRAGPIEMSPIVPWGLWNFRKRFGPTQLLEWGIHDSVIEKLWLELGDLPASDANAFAKEWVDGSLLAFMTALPARLRPALPWQLGGATPVLSDGSWAEVLTWLRGQAVALGLPAKTAYWSYDQSALTSPSLRARTFGAFAHEASLVASEPTLKQLAVSLDARLLLEDIRRRVPEAAQSRVKRVVFRATPKRVVDAAVVELTEPGHYGALVRHLVPAAAEGKTAAELAWVEGTRDDVVAAVPGGLFEAAVRAVASAT